MLDKLFFPKSVAVIGASNNKLSIGNRVMKNLLDHGYKGKIFPINPKDPEVLGVKAYPNILDVPEPVDIANISIKNTLCPEAVEQCGIKGVQFVLIHTAGFREVGGEGAKLEDSIMEAARNFGIRVYGPNSQGVMNSDEEVSLYANFTFTPMTKGNISIIAQSGGVAEVLNLNLRKRGFGFRLYASNGNAMDVSINEILDYFGQDEKTKVILLHIESMKEPEEFIRITGNLTQNKPILALRSGKTEEGAHAISSHTGTLAGKDMLTDAIFERCGILRFHSMEEMVDTAVGLCSQPLPRGKNVTVVTNAGGYGIIATDECVEGGLKLSQLKDVTKNRLKQGLDPSASVENPVDVAATANPEQFELTIDSLLKDENVDSVILNMVTPFFVDCEGIARKIKERTKGADKPLLPVVMTNENWQGTVKIIREAGLPVYDFPETACRVLKRMTEYAEIKTRKKGKIPVFDVDSKRAKQIFMNSIPESSGFISYSDSIEILECYGIPFVPTQIVENEQNLIDFIAKHGFPVLLKIDSPLHKSDAGGVVLNIKDKERLLDKFIWLKDKFKSHKIIIQKFLTNGKEVIFGFKRFEGLPPVIMFGLGGIFVEVLKDVRFILSPVSKEDAENVITKIKGYPLLKGVRGEKGVNISALSEILMRLSQLALDLNEISELDLNPVIAFEKDTVAVDIRMKK